MNFLIKTLHTNRLKLRRLKPSDLDDIYDYSSKASAVRLLNWGPHTSLRESETYLNEVLDSYEKTNPENFVWGIALNESDRIVGVVRAFNYSDISLRIELSYILNPSFQGKGLMKEALKSIIDFLFELEKINRIQAHCSTDNIASFNLLMALSFKKEGLLRSFWNIKGTFKNVYVLSKIKNID